MLVKNGIRCISTSSMMLSNSAFSIFEKSCYHKIDFRINENNSAHDAIIKFTTFNVGCLAVTNDKNKVIGVISERDYINKVAFYDKNHNDTKIKDICTFDKKLIVAKKNDCIDVCMQKMLFKDIRHLLIVDDKEDDVIGMISIKDLIKEIQKKNHEIILRLSDFNLGKGAYFGSE